MTSQLPIQIANSFYSFLTCTCVLPLWKTFRHPWRYCKGLRQTRSIKKPCCFALNALVQMRWLFVFRKTTTEIFTIARVLQLKRST